jgi:hypothetical protein
VASRFDIESSFMRYCLRYAKLDFWHVVRKEYSFKYEYFSSIIVTLYVVEHTWHSQIDIGNRVKLSMTLWRALRLHISYLSPFAQFEQTVRLA